MLEDKVKSIFLKKEQITAYGGTKSD